MKEKQKVVDYLRELTKKVEDAQCKVEAEINTRSYGQWPVTLADHVFLDLIFDHTSNQEKPFEAKEGDFIRINEEYTTQLREDYVGQEEINSATYGVIYVHSIRIATEEEVDEIISRLKTLEWIEGEDGIWREPKLEEVYCVAEKMSDFIKVYSSRLDLIDNEWTDTDLECNSISFYDGKIWNGNGSDKIEISIEKFIELLKKA